MTTDIELQRTADLVLMRVPRGGVDDALQMLLGKKTSMAKRPGGAPYLVGDDHFVSLSHKDNYLILAVSTRPVGVDIEKLADKPTYYRIADSYFAEKIEEGDVQGFFRSWTRREAYGKLLGTGLTTEVMGLDMQRQHLQNNGENVYFVEYIVDDYMITAASFYDKGELVWNGGENDE